MAGKKPKNQPKKNDDVKLTEQQELFCQEYVIDYNGTKAAIRAGYSQKTAKSQAHRLLTKEHILARIRAIQKERLEKLAVTQESVLLNLLEIYDRCMQAKPVLEWDYGEKKYVETGEYTFDSKGALKAMEMIGKHLAMFTNKIEHSSDQKGGTGIILMPTIQNALISPNEESAEKENE